MTANGESVVVGLAVGAGSLVVQMLGVSPGVIAAAVAACIIGAPFAKPAGGRLRAVAMFGASIVVTCHAAAWLALFAMHTFPWLAAHEARAQAGAAVIFGVALHIIVSHVPAVLANLLTRFKVVT